MLRPIRLDDTEAVCSIYNYYVRETVVTFEESPVPPPDMERRVLAVTESHPWLVWEEHDRVLGYAYAAPWHQRAAYRRSVETTIYLAPEATGRRVGQRLYGGLLDALAGRGLHCAVGVIALPNVASVALHQRLGFAPVGILREVGWKFGAWVDVGYWERML